MERCRPLLAVATDWLQPGPRTETTRLMRSSPFAVTAACSELGPTTPNYAEVGFAFHEVDDSGRPQGRRLRAAPHSSRSLKNQSSVSFRLDREGLGLPSTARKPHCVRLTRTVSRLSQRRQQRSPLPR
jgi:hypothetical protein